MMDMYMVVALAVFFGMFYAFAQWCGHVIDDKGGKSNDSGPDRNAAVVSLFGLRPDSSGEILGSAVKNSKTYRALS